MLDIEYVFLKDFFLKKIRTFVMLYYMFSICVSMSF